MPPSRWDADIVPVQKGNVHEWKTETENRIRFLAREPGKGNLLKGTGRKKNEHGE